MECGKGGGGKVLGEEAYLLRMVSSLYYSDGNILNVVWVVSSDGKVIGRVTTLKMTLIPNQYKLFFSRHQNQIFRAK